MHQKGKKNKGKPLFSVSLLFSLLSFFLVFGFAAVQSYICRSHIANDCLKMLNGFDERIVSSIWMFFRFFISILLNTLLTTYNLHTWIGYVLFDS